LQWQPWICSSSSSSERAAGVQMQARRVHTCVWACIGAGHSCDNSKACVQCNVQAATGELCALHCLVCIIR
jgi:hypothetical protein